ncbi:hypothetical protein A2U01_0069147, partial [Trifolium medium]|nr:hypothetical protein [Trifolium medium]
MVIVEDEGENWWGERSTAAVLVYFLALFLILLLVKNGYGELKQRQGRGGEAQLAAAVPSFL